MGINYEWIASEAPCAHCARPYERRHIGLSAAGWCFQLHVYPNDGIHNLDDWAALFAQPVSVIKDEYGVVVAPEEMLRVITGRAWMGGRGPNFDYARNDAVLGPHGLLRAKIDGHHCIGHGAGTWDLLIGEFS